MTEETYSSSQELSGNIKNEKIKEYNKRLIVNKLVRIFLQIIVLIGIIASDVPESSIKVIQQVTSLYYLQFVLFVIWILIIIEFFEFPFEMFGEYLLEHLYDLSNQTFKEYILEKLKKVFIGGIISLPILFFFAYVLKNSVIWWLWLALFMFLFSILLARIFPNIIFPLFYKLNPIENEDLKSKIANIAKKAGIAVTGIYEFNLSKETRKANAALIGLGRAKKIILSDTLLSHFTPNEIVAVFAHECGHFIKKHIIKNILFNFVIMVFLFYLANKLYFYFINYIKLSYNWELEGIPYLMLILILLSFIINPIQNAISRKFEYEADRQSVTLTGEKYAFISALKKLGELNYADPNPSTLIEWYFYSHPSINKRINALDQVKMGVVDDKN